MSNGFEHVKSPDRLGCMKFISIIPNVDSVPWARSPCSQNEGAMLQRSTWDWLLKGRRGETFKDDAWNW